MTRSIESASVSSVRAALRTAQATVQALETLLNQLLSTQQVAESTPVTEPITVVEPVITPVSVTPVEEPVTVTPVTHRVVIGSPRVTAQVLTASVMAVYAFSIGVSDPHRSTTTALGLARFSDGQLKSMIARLEASWDRMTDEECAV